MSHYTGRLLFSLTRSRDEYLRVVEILEMVEYIGIYVTFKIISEITNKTLFETTPEL